MSTRLIRVLLLATLALIINASKCSESSEEDAPASANDPATSSSGEEAGLGNSAPSDSESLDSDGGEEVESDY